MPKIAAEISDALLHALSRHLEHSCQSLDEVVSDALTKYFETGADTIFQVSTSSALLEGVYRGAITVGALLEHGDHGLGTFEDLDGEMIVVDGQVSQARSDGTVEEVSGAVKTPFASVTDFSPSSQSILAQCLSYEEIQQEFDGGRDSENMFYALRVTGFFDTVHVRAMCKTKAGVPLVEAAAVQPEFIYEKMEGTLVGFWSPHYARSFNVPGYHLHFLSREHKKGGHLLGCSGTNLKLEWQRESGMVVVLPETKEFLRADLSHDPAADLEKAEKAQTSKTKT